MMTKQEYIKKFYGERPVPAHIDKEYESWLAIEEAGIAEQATSIPVTDEAPQPSAASPTPEEAGTPPVEEEETPAMVMLTFSEAVAAMLKGERLSKVQWNDSQLHVYLKDGILKILNAKEGYREDNWILSEADMLGTDYFVV